MTRIAVSSGKLTETETLRTMPTIPGTTLPIVGGTTLRNFEYDGLSRLTQHAENDDPLNVNHDWTVTCLYDSLSRPVEEHQNDA